MNNLQPFITGSRAYGTCTVESDIDLVIPPMSEKDFVLLAGVSELQKPPIHYGRLNVIVASSIESFAAWKDGTEELIKRAPVTRDEAIEFLDDLFTSRGIQKSAGDSGI